MLSKDKIRKLKASLPVRAISWPYMSIKKKREYKEYQGSEDSQKMRQFKNLYQGKRCFIIGNGPSLKVSDLEKLKDEVTIASNRIYEIFPDTDWRPTIYMAEDPDGLGELVPKVQESNIKQAVLSTNAKKFENNNTTNIVHGFWTNKRFVINRYNDKSSHISEDVSKYFSTGYTVTFSAIQLAIYMGIKEIYLLGVDFNYSVVSDQWGRMKRLDGVQTYFNKNERKGSYLNYYSVLYAYNQAKKYCDAHGIKIYNATRGGKLEVFERVDFDSLFK